MGFRDTPSSELLALVTEISQGRPWHQVVAERYAASNPWLHRIVTDPIRASFFGPVMPEGRGIALDIGAGWGQISRPLASRRPTAVMEPVAERLAFIQASAKQENVDGSMAYLQADYLEIAFATRFEVISAIGVLEWVGAFQTETAPQERQRMFLRKARTELAPNGHLILGIENRLGLKYLLGCPDDHIGAPNIACLPAALAAKRWKESTGHTLRSFTYSMSELKELLHEAGFTSIEFFAAFPDYKLPSQILPIEQDGQTLNKWLLSQEPPAEHNGYDGSPLDASFQEILRAHYHTLAAEGIAHHFVPSFFVRAG